MWQCGVRVVPTSSNSYRSKFRRPPHLERVPFEAACVILRAAVAAIRRHIVYDAGAGMRYLGLMMRKVPKGSALSTYQLP